MLFLYREPYSVSALTTIAARITEYRPSSFEAIIPVYKTRAALEDLGSWINAFVVSPYQSFKEINRINPLLNNYVVSGDYQNSQ